MASLDIQKTGHKEECFAPNWCAQELEKKTILLFFVFGNFLSVHSQSPKEKAPGIFELDNTDSYIFLVVTVEQSEAANA